MLNNPRMQPKANKRGWRNLYASARRIHYSLLFLVLILFIVYVYLRLLNHVESLLILLTGLTLLPVVIFIRVTLPWTRNRLVKNLGPIPLEFAKIQTEESLNELRLKYRTESNVKYPRFGFHFHFLFVVAEKGLLVGIIRVPDTREISLSVKYTSNIDEYIARRLCSALDRRMTKNHTASD